MKLNLKNVMNILGYIILIAFIIICFIFFHSFPMFVVAVFLVLLPFVELFFSKYAFDRILIDVSTTQGKVEKNLEFPLKIKIENKSFIPILRCQVGLKVSNKFYNHQEDVELLVPLYIRHIQEIIYPLKSKYSGTVCVDVDNVIISDFLGFISFQKDYEAKKEIAIIPKIIDDIKVDYNSLRDGNDESEESFRKGNDFSEISNIREYIPGDSLRDIHWKLSVKKDELMVKEHVSMSSQQIVVLLELYDDKKYVLDSIIDVTYSLARNMIKDNVPFTLCYYSSITEELKKLMIINKQQLNECFSMILLEKSYNSPSYGKHSFSNSENYISNVIWINTIGKSGEMLYNFEDKVYINLMSEI